MSDSRFIDDDLDWLREVKPPKGGKPDRQKFNPNHAPAGSPEGGQFTSGDGDGGGGGKGDHPGEGYSSTAYEDANGVIHTDNVYDAALALAQDRKVELDQPKTLSTLIQHLGMVARNMDIMGERAPNYNLCNVSVEGTNLFCVESRGIPRIEMPQLNAQQTKDFVGYLKDQGYDVSKGREYAANLRATQNELNGAKVAGIMQRIDSGEFDPNDARLIVSRDNYILDGHHRWAADIGVDAENGVLNDEKKIKITRVDISITKLLAEAETFTGGEGKKPASERAACGCAKGEQAMRTIDQQVNRAYSVLTIKSVDVERRQIRGTATTPTPDRMGDIVEPKGIKFKNPMPLLWQHDHKQPVGWVRFGEATERGIEFEAQIAASDGMTSNNLKERLAEAWDSVKSKLVGAVSIGFKALEYELIEAGKGFESGIKFISSEVMELSLVTIPANAEATISQIRSLDHSQLAASGRTPTGCERPSKQPGVAGKTGVDDVHADKRKGKTMPKTVAEQISAFEATRAAKTARMTEIMTKAGEDGSTLEDSESQEYDTLETDVKKVDEHLKRLNGLQETIKASAIVVDGAAAAARVGGEVINGNGGYTGVRAIVKAPKVEPWQPMVRWAMLQAYLAKAGMQANIDEYTAPWKDSTPEIAFLARKDIPMLLQGSMNGLIPRAAVGAGTTTDATWASPLIVYTQMSDQFAEYLRPLTIIGRIPGLRRVPFNIQIPVASSGSTVGWVGEGAPKPVGQLAFTSITLRWAKAAGIVVITDELARFSNPSAEALVRDDLTRQMVQFLDRQFVDPTVAEVTNVSPASITNGVTAINTTGNDAAAFRTDVSTLMASVLSNNLNSASGVWIMTQQQAMKIGAMNNTFSQPIYPEMRTQTSSEGSLFGFPVVASENVPATGGSPSDGYPIIFALANEILLADDGVTNIDASNQASLQMDSAPDSPPTASTNMVSLWQTNMTGLRAERWINWKKRRSTAVSYIANAKYA